MLGAKFSYVAKRFSSTGPVSPDFLMGLLKRVQTVEQRIAENQHKTAMNQKNRSAAKSKYAGAKTGNRPFDNRKGRPAARSGAKTPSQGTKPQATSKKARQFTGGSYGDAVNGFSPGKVGAVKAMPEKKLSKLHKRTSSVRAVEQVTLARVETSKYYPEEPTPLSLARYAPGSGTNPATRAKSFLVNTLRQDCYPIGPFRFHNDPAPSEAGGVRIMRYRLVPSTNGAVQLLLEPRNNNVTVLPDAEELRSAILGEYKPVDIQALGMPKKPLLKGKAMQTHLEHVKLAVEGSNLPTEYKTLLYELGTGMKSVSEASRPA
ncbi:AFR340Wp [Eremothecium gossypii ATCC 10895]|uniref:AFR340Wp n=1 Tax=Eremothecium gossypii (strain ATCC 10895 / CBS 109.51 / FGSC 9923 / NRRL Y-1056) TaxID=284811 RepID=Q753H2_EREGS|nr:AFR340Wp [Eremothecium gossypii ATCC 10895]AAS53711.1 AFR340Wp [Eremothecium gossypii ATCC 10895]AEY98024.1 FAFR340Wp [Eremothecium gossypii FDAG1]